MSRSVKEVFSKSHNPKSRSSHIDYDYLNKLNEADQQWLAKFTDEYYGATFDTNPAYMLKSELLDLITSKIGSTSIESKKRKWIAHQRRVELSKKKMIQISNCEKKSDNIDLRSCRRYNVYYKDLEGNYTTSERFKYASTNVNEVGDREVRNECTERSAGQNRCVMSMFGASPIENDEVMDYAESILGPEEVLIKIEESRMEEVLNSSNNAENSSK